MRGQDPTQRMPIMIGSALTVDFAGGRIQEGKQIGRSISSIVKVLQSRLIGRYRQRGCEAIECLNARTLVKTVQVSLEIGIAPNDVFHFMKKIRIGDL